MSKHTPGPLQAVQTAEDFTIKRDGIDIAYHVDSNYADLFAAAPKMLEALNEAPITLLGESAEAFFIRYKAWYRNYRYDAISKAQGE